VSPGAATPAPQIGVLAEGGRVSRRVRVHAVEQRTRIAYGCRLGGGVGVRRWIRTDGVFPLRVLLRDTPLDERWGCALNKAVRRAPWEIVSCDWW
jgi:hypothetical protein